MNIVEAVKATTLQRPYITRKAWNRVTPNPCDAAVKIQPTDSPDRCILISVSSRDRPWHPGTADLIADDWELVP